MFDRSYQSRRGTAVNAGNQQPSALFNVFVAPRTESTRVEFTGFVDDRQRECHGRFGQRRPKCRVRLKPTDF
jgi:hypothetical protein